MRARVVVSDGKRCMTLVWLEYTGADVYCHTLLGLQEAKHHDSAQIRWERLDGGRPDRISKHARVAGVEGSFGLVTMSFDPLLPASDAVSGDSGTPGTALLNIDVRGLPEDGLCKVMVGMLEPERVDLLSVSNMDEFVPAYLALATNVTPWVYATVWTLEG